MKKLILALFITPSLCLASKPVPKWGNEHCVPPWQQIKVSTEVRMCRLAVPHGWLIVTYGYYVDSLNPSTRFLSDEAHEWTIGDQK